MPFKDFSAPPGHDCAELNRRGWITGVRFIQKPFSMKALAAKVREALAPAPL